MAVLAFFVFSFKRAFNVDVLQRRAEAWYETKQAKIGTIALIMELWFYNYQIIYQYTESQSVEWEGPFDGYVDAVMGLATLDLSFWVPSLECIQGYSAYSTMLVWALGPMLA